MLVKEFELNLTKAKTICQSFIHEINNNGFKSKQVLLRSYTRNTFDAIFLIDENDYLNDDFLRIYNLGQKIQKEQRNDNFNISFSFMPDSKKINEKKLIIDGYVLKYLIK